MRWVAAALSVVGLLGFGAILVMAFGMVHGDEFSPNAFDRRSFSYYQIPLLRLQFTPITRRSSTGSLEKYIATNQLVPALADDEEPLWQIATIQHGPLARSQFGPQILCTYLDIRSEKNVPLWEEWSVAHADAAKVFWPAIAEVARLQQYAMMPDLFSLANSETNAKTLQTELDRELAKGYLAAATRAADRQQWEAAKTLVQHGLARATDDATVRAKLESLKTKLPEVSPE